MWFSFLICKFLGNFTLDHAPLTQLNCYINVAQPSLKLGPTQDLFIFFHEKKGKKDMIKSCDWKQYSSKIEKLHKTEIKTFEMMVYCVIYIDLYLWVLFVIGESIFLHVQTDLRKKR